MKSAAGVASARDSLGRKRPRPLASSAVMLAIWLLMGATNSAGDANPRFDASQLLCVRFQEGRQDRKAYWLCSPARRLPMIYTQPSCKRAQRMCSTAWLPISPRLRTRLGNCSERITKYFDRRTDRKD